MAVSSQQDLIYVSRPNANHINFHDLMFSIYDQLDEYYRFPTKKVFQLFVHDELHLIQIRSALAWDRHIDVCFMAGSLFTRAEEATTISHHPPPSIQ
jgi:hypothetical protein